MAYGFDIDEIYYTDHDRVDMGILDTYEIDLDLAGEKDFQIVSPYLTLEIGGFWYVDGTEYGGMVTAMRIENDEQVTYTGKSWRGILHDHVLIVPDNREYRYVQGDVTDVLNDLITECGLDDVFVVAEPLVSETIDTEVADYSFERGTTLYDAIKGIIDACNLTLEFSYHNKIVTLTPLPAQDYSEYMVYSNIDSMGYEMEEDAGVANHYYVVAVNQETHRRRSIHVFADENGAYQPYTTRTPTSDKPLKDSDYILDRRNQVLFGIDEVCIYEEVEESVAENYELLDTAPANWQSHFAMYWTNKDENGDTMFAEDGSFEYREVEAIDMSYYSLQGSKPADWNNQYSKYFTRDYDPVTGSYVYNTVGAETELDMSTRTQVTKKPADWNSNYGEYWYRYWNGNEWVYENIPGRTKTQYVKMKSKPTDWATNFGSYYKYQAEVKMTAKEIAEAKKKKKKKPKKGWLKVVDLINKKEGKPVSVPSASEKEQKAPKFVVGKYYRQVQSEIPAKWGDYKTNCWRFKTREVAPTWASGTYYTKTVNFVAPNFQTKTFFELVLDHYAGMVADAVEYFTENKKTQTSKFTLDDFTVNIGDIVAGRNEFTGKVLDSKPVTNINLKLTNGLIEAEYVIGG